MSFSSGFKQFAHHISEAERDIEAAIRAPGVMSRAARLKGEFKAVGGVASAIAGCAEMNPVAFFCGAGTAAEGLHDLRQAGHRYCARHPEFHAWFF